MDVITLHENNIKTAVAPLGTALTETQLRFHGSMFKNQL